MIYSWITIFQFEDAFHVYGFQPGIDGTCLGTFTEEADAETCAKFPQSFKGIRRIDMRDEVTA